VNSIFHGDNVYKNGSIFCCVATSTRILRRCVYNDDGKIYDGRLLSVKRKERKRKKDTKLEKMHTNNAVAYV
jgi:hypothetical protein